MSKKPLVRIRLDLNGSEADQFLRIKDHLGVKNDTEVVRVILNRYAREHKQELKATLQHFNLNEQGVMILDHSLDPPRIIQVFFKRDGTAECELCESQQCRHIKYALSLPEVMGILRQKGWTPT